MDKDYYIYLRDEYLPDDLRLIFLAESPPVSGKYFYDPNGKVSEPLFRALMHDILDISPRDKSEGLRAFRDKGMFLVDATYQPVNKDLSRKQRNEIVVKDYPRLKQELRRIIGKKNIPILIIKVNVCELLETELLNDNFKVLNNGRSVPFPGSGQQRNFGRVVRSLLSTYIERDYQMAKHTGVGQMTLHEAMMSILRMATGAMHPKDIADSINKLGLYMRKDRLPLRANQIRARAKRYPRLFVITTDNPALIILK